MAKAYDIDINFWAKFHEFFLIFFHWGQNLFILLFPKNANRTS